MRGDLDFADVAAGPGAAARRARRRRRSTTYGDDLVLARGARTFVRTLKRLDYRLAIVSGGFTQVTDGLVADLGIDYSAANTLEIVDGRLTGELLGAVVDRAGKADALERFAARGRRPGVPDRRDRRRRQRPRHAGPGRAGHRLQRQAGRPGRRRRSAERARTSTRSCSCSASPATRSRRPTRPRASRCSRRRPEPGAVSGSASRARLAAAALPCRPARRRPTAPGFSPCRSPVRLMTTCSMVGLCPTTTCTGTSVGAERARPPPAAPAW